VKTSAPKPVKRQRTKPVEKKKRNEKTEAVVPAGSNWTPRGPDPLASSVVASEPVSATVSAVDTSSSLLPLALGAALGLALLVVAVAATPPWVVPRQMNVLVYEHREPVIVWGLAMAISIGLGLLVALLGS
jgi:hypothetical protein